MNIDLVHATEAEVLKWQLGELTTQVEYMKQEMRFMKKRLGECESILRGEDNE